MLIDPKRTIVLCYQYGGFDGTGQKRWRHMKVSMCDWLLKTFPHENIYGINIHPYLPARNRPIRDLVVPNLDRFDYLLSVDHDITISHPGLERFLTTKGDVVACRHKKDNSHAWKKPGSFHAGFWRARTKIFRFLKAPWFLPIFSEDGCNYLGCDCEYFAARVRAVGFSVSSGGRCGHQCNSGTLEEPIGHKPDWYYKTVEEGALEKDESGDSAPRVVTGTV